MNRIAKTKANPENYYPSEKRKIRPSRNIHAVPRKIRLSCFFPSYVLSDGIDNCSICLLYYLVRGKRPDFLPRGTASCSCHVCVSPLHRQTDVFVSQINWPCSPPTNESKGAEVQKQVLCSMHSGTIKGRQATCRRSYWWICAVSSRPVPQGGIPASR